MKKSKLFSRLIVIESIIFIILELIIIFYSLMIDKPILETIPSLVIVGILGFCIYIIHIKYIKNSYMLLTLLLGLLGQLIGGIKIAGDLFNMGKLFTLVVVSIYLFSYLVLIIFAISKRKLIFVKTQKNQ